MLRLTSLKSDCSYAMSPGYVTAPSWYQKTNERNSHKKARNCLKHNHTCNCRNFQNEQVGSLFSRRCARSQSHTPMSTTHLHSGGTNYNRETYWWHSHNVLGKHITYTHSSSRQLLRYSLFQWQKSVQIKSGAPKHQPPSVAIYGSDLWAFRHSAPAVWNSLPRTVLESTSLTVFKSRLKTHLFHLAHNRQ